MVPRRGCPIVIAYGCQYETTDLRSAMFDFRQAVRAKIASEAPGVALGAFPFSTYADVKLLACRRQTVPCGAVADGYAGEATLAGLFYLILSPYLPCTRAVSHERKHVREGYTAVSSPSVMHQTQVVDGPIRIPYGW